jgi:ankyrin repeat protein
MLCENGANVNTAQAINGRTALMWSSNGSHLEVARLLLQVGANKAAVSFNGSTAFSAASGPNKAALQELLKP